MAKKTKKSAAKDNGNGPHNVTTAEQRAAAIHASMSTVKAISLWANVASAINGIKQDLRSYAVAAYLFVESGDVRIKALLAAGKQWNGTGAVPTLGKTAELLWDSFGTNVVRQQVEGLARLITAEIKTGLDICSLVGTTVDGKRQIKDTVLRSLCKDPKATASADAFRAALNFYYSEEGKASRKARVQGSSAETAEKAAKKLTNLSERLTAEMTALKATIGAIRTAEMSDRPDLPTMGILWDTYESIGKDLNNLRDILPETKTGTNG